MDIISISENFKTDLETEEINKNINDKVKSTAQKANWMLIYLNIRTKTHSKLKKSTFKASKRKHSEHFNAHENIRIEYSTKPKSLKQFKKYIFMPTAQ